jgi:hypothetical protein
LPTETANHLFETDNKKEPRKPLAKNCCNIKSESVEIEKASNKSFAAAAV